MPEGKVADEPGGPDNLIVVDFAKRGQRPPASASHTDTPQARSTEGLYTVHDVAGMFGYTPARLRYWDTTGLLKPSAEVDERRYYTFVDLVGVRVVKELLGQGVGLRKVRAAVKALATRAERPLSELRVQADGQRVVVADQQGRYEPTTGQGVLDFSVQALGAEVVELVRVTEAAKKRAYEYYLRACQLDEDEETFDQAEALYRKALTLDPTLANALTNLGNLCYRRSELDQAERYYREALTLDRTQPEAHYDLGLIHFERGELRDAIARFESALQSDPSFADAHFNLAMAYEQNQQSDKARPHWSTYIRLEPVGPWTDVAHEHLRENR